MPTLYTDKFVTVSPEGIRVRRYYFPLGAKFVPADRIAEVSVLRGPCARLWGTGDFTTWFARDMGRLFRDRVFVLSLKDSGRRIGFSATDPDALIAALETQGLLGSTVETAPRVQVVPFPLRPMHIITAALLALMIAASIAAYPHLPASVGIHWGLKGDEPDGFGPKHLAVLLPPLLAGILAILMFPMEYANLASAPRAAWLFRFMGAAGTALFCYLHLITLAWNMGYRLPMGILIKMGLGGFVAAVAVSIGVLMYPTRLKPPAK